MIKNIFEHNNLKSIHLANPITQDFAPLIILLPAFDGQSEFVLTYAHRIVDQGFQVVIADLFGNGAKFTSLEDCFTAVTPIIEDRALARSRTVENIIAATQYTDTDIEEVGIMGFCIGGMCAIEAARSGLKAKAYFCAHGNLTKDDNLTSNFASGINIQLAQGYSDPLVETNQLKAFAEELGTNNWSCIFYGNTKHSYTDHNVGLLDPIKEAELGREYNPISAHNCFQQAMTFFENHLC